MRLSGKSGQCHRFRYSSAPSVAIATGADVTLVQQMLGHADTTETLNSYSHLWPDRIDEISIKLDAARDTTRVSASAPVSPIAQIQT